MTHSVTPEELRKQIFPIEDDFAFEKIALQLFRFQASNNRFYQKYLSLLNIDPGRVKKISDIPFLPIDFFKDHTIVSSDSVCDVIFTSSGTTGVHPSRHYVVDRTLYEESFLKTFSSFYHSPAEYAFLALLPSYLERNDSSLIYMMNRFIKESGNSDSDFYLYHDDRLKKKIERLTERKSKFILFGVSFALLELAEQFEFDFGNNIVMETGGMKGKRKEIVREDFHSILCKKFHVTSVHSEYGMTELLSQAYSKGNGIFFSPPWMKILIRDLNDPFAGALENKTGGINVIDFANMYSCSFIETQDLGKKNPDGSFEVLGRIDSSEIRGCNLLFQ